ncbi:MAG: hypothetical protein FDZ75_00960 [Actinobacteria bacterium]|nr:MAG: hypothetical protein FDZ75_00960 [Actinomycetota bacterium]
MTAFRSEAEVRSWLALNGKELGALITPQVLFELGRDWYATRFDVDWEPLTAEQATDLFAAHGLVGEFWSLV